MKNRTIYCITIITPLVSERNKTYKFYSFIKFFHASMPFSCIPRDWDEKRMVFLKDRLSTQLDGKWSFFHAWMARQTRRVVDHKISPLKLFLDKNETRNLKEILNGFQIYLKLVIKEKIRRICRIRFLCLLLMMRIVISLLLFDGTNHCYYKKKEI